MIPAIEVLKPVKFWKSLKTNDAGCLCVLHASIVTIIAMKETILKISNPFETLSRIFAPHILMNVATNVIEYATRTVCHRSIS